MESSFSAFITYSLLLGLFTEPKRSTAEGAGAELRGGTGDPVALRDAHLAAHHSAQRRLPTRRGRGNSNYNMMYLRIIRSIG